MLPPFGFAFLALALPELALPLEDLPLDELAPDEPDLLKPLRLTALWPDESGVDRRPSPLAELPGRPSRLKARRSAPETPSLLLDCVRGRSVTVT